MRSSFLLIACAMAPMIAMAQADNTPDPKELATVQKIRAKIEQQAKKPGGKS